MKAARVGLRLLHGMWEGTRRYGPVRDPAGRESASSGGNREVLGTEVAPAGGPACNSPEATVMGVE